MNYDNNNRGSIWRNEKKTTDKHPDFTGKATVDEVEYYVSAWKRGPDDNPKSPALRFSFTAVEDVAKKTIQQAKQSIHPDIDSDIDDDSIPF